ncbi:MAG: EAL and HDOD domain-containing protein [Fibrobacterota bacterium]
MATVFLGRQPIFNRDMSVYGYELLYRSNELNSADFIDGNRATSSVLVNSFFEFGIGKIVGNSRAFINMPRDFITGKYELPIEADNVVLEILEDIEYDDEIAASIRRLQSRGFALALDDYAGGAAECPFTNLVDIVKLELPAYTRFSLLKTVNYLKSTGVSILAEKVESREDFDFCRKIGCDLFQGYFFCRPNILKTDKVPRNELAILRLIKRVNDPQVGFDELEHLVSQDVTLSYRILKYINSATFCLRTPVESIKRALTYIGLNKLKQWIYIISIADISDDPAVIPLIETSMIRSRMCELLARSIESPGHAPTLFSTVGLFSTLDAVVGRSMEVVLSELPFSEEINSALTQRQGIPGKVLSLVIELEQGKRQADDGFQNISAKEIGELYISSIKWVNSNMHDIFS